MSRETGPIKLTMGKNAEEAYLGENHTFSIGCAQFSIARHLSGALTKAIWYLMGLFNGEEETQVSSQVLTLQVFLGHLSQSSPSTP